MASVESFESTLKEVVHGKRLSASKITNLTDIALKIMEYDTQMVSILYRTHKSLHSRSKVASLYAFDALCRAARHQAVKQGITSETRSEKGNSLTFLKKMEGVLEGLVEDMMTCDAPEAKEKTRKILDIWTKSSTFGADVMSRLMEVVKRTAEKETKQTSTNSTAPADPRVQPHPSQGPSLISPPSVSTPAPTNTTSTAENAQAALLALLASAAAAKTNIGSLSNGIPGTAQSPVQVQTQLDSMQLALLQQLASKASVVSQPQQNNHHAVLSAIMASAQPPAQLDPSPNSAHEQINTAGPSTSTNYSSAHPAQYKSYHSHDHRDPRQGNYESRGRGRGAFQHDDRRQTFHRQDGAGSRLNSRDREWDDRNNRGGPRSQIYDRDRYRDKGEWRASNGRMDRSRSRSPPRNILSGSSRDIKPYSPPHRPSLQRISIGRSRSPEQQRALSPGATEPGKDEFGRDIRSASVERKTSVAREEMSITIKPNVLQDVKEEAFIPSPPTTAEKSSSVDASGGAQSWGLESFDLSSFNPTDAESWKALGDAFAVSNGYMPSQEELMQFIMNAMAFQAQKAGFGDMDFTTGFQEEYNDPGNEDQQLGGYSGAGVPMESTYKVGTGAGQEDGKGDTIVPIVASSGVTGQMQKIGDKWIFVRNKAIQS